MTNDQQPQQPRNPVAIAADLVRREDDPLSNEAARLIVELERQLDEARRELDHECPKCIMSRDSSIAEEGCVNCDLVKARQEVERLKERLAEIDAGANADEADLQQMRDGTKLTRAGVVQIVVYQQQDIRELKSEIARLASENTALRAALDDASNSIHQIVESDGIDAGVILLSSESPTRYDATAGVHVYEHENFSPLGDALVKLAKIIDAARAAGG